MLQETSDGDTVFVPSLGLAAFSTFCWTLPSSAPIPLASQDPFEE